MKSFYSVQGTQSIRPLELEVNVTTVYLRSNIQHIQTDDFIGWQYDEIQYSKDEFLEQIAKEKDNLKIENEKLKEDISTLQGNLDQAVLELTTVISMQGSGM